MKSLLGIYCLEVLQKLLNVINVSFVQSEGLDIEVEMIMNLPLDSAENVEITNIFQEFVRIINIKRHAYFFSDCRNSFNEVLNKQEMNGNYFFINPVGTVMSLGRPIQGII